MFWNSIIFSSIILVIGSHADAALYGYGKPINAQWLQQALEDFVRELWPPRVARAFEDWRIIFGVHLLYMSPISVQGSFDATYKFTMDILTNGARIAFALVFLCSFLARPVHYRLSAILHNAINSNTPFFTLLFGAIGGVVGALSIFLKSGVADSIHI